MALIQESQIRRYRKILEPIIPMVVEKVIPNPGSGRTMNPDVVGVMLLSWMLAFSTHGKLGYPALEDIWLTDIDREAAWRHGFLKATAKGERPTLSQDGYYELMSKLDDRLGWTLERHPHLTLDERRERRAFVENVCDTLLDASIFYEPKAKTYSLDESGIWAWRIGTFKQKRSSADIDAELTTYDETEGNKG